VAHRLRLLSLSIALAIASGIGCSSSGAGGVADASSGDASDAGAESSQDSSPPEDSALRDGSTDVSEDVSHDASRDAQGEGAPGCAPVQHLSFTSSTVVPLGCDANTPVLIMDEPVPITGRAVGRVTFSVQHTGINAVTHFWNLQVAVGTPTYAFGLGDDVCPATTSARANLGFGTLSAAAGHVQVHGYSGAAPCTAGTLQVLAGATLEVWVEDGSPGCAGGDIAFGSYYGANGYTTQYDWTTSYSALPGVTASVATHGPSEQMRVLGVVEGSPGLDPNMVCGSEVSTIDMQTQLDGMTMEYLRDVVPASQGMGHRVLYTAGDVNELRSVSPGMHTASLLVATDFVVTGYNVTTGGCCGDGEVALVRLR
jgi:hypothetical protein